MKKIHRSVILFAVFAVVFSVAPAETSEQTKSAGEKAYEAYVSEDNSSQTLVYRYYHVLYNHILRTAPGKGSEWADAVARTVLVACSKYQVDPLLVASLFTQESKFSNDAVSSTGAIGIAQLMPDTARSLGVNPHDPAQNIDGGVKYLGYLLNKYQNTGEWRATYAIAAYNAGPKAVDNYGGVPPYSETMNHVRIIANVYQNLAYEMAALR